MPLSDVEPPRLHERRRLDYAGDLRRLLRRQRTYGLSNLFKEKMLFLLSSKVVTETQ